MKKDTLAQAVGYSGSIAAGHRDFISDLQAILGDKVEVTAEIAQQLRGVGIFNVLIFSPQGHTTLKIMMPVAARLKTAGVDDRFNLRSEC